MLLSDLLVRYFAQNIRIRNENTRRQYRYALRDWTEQLGRDPLQSDLTDESLGRFATWLLDKKLEPKTVNERVGRIAALWRWLVKVGELRRMPLIDRVREPRRAPVAWTIEDLRRLISSLESLPGRVGPVPARDWWRSLHLVAWSTGERISALMAVRWEWIAGDFLTIPAEVRKGRASDRVYRLSAKALAALETIREPSRALVWCWPHAPSNRPKVKLSPAAEVGGLAREEIGRRPYGVAGPRFAACHAVVFGPARLPSPNG